MECTKFSSKELNKMKIEELLEKGVEFNVTGDLGEILVALSRGEEVEKVTEEK